MSKAWHFLQSPANWCGVGMATLMLVMHGAGLIGAWWLPMVAAGYATGFGVGVAWMGWPRMPADPWDELEFRDEGDARLALERALSAIRKLVEENPDDRLSEALRQKVLLVCDRMEGLLQHWERSKGSLSLEESFHARHIALEYLPDALRGYLSIPAKFAQTRQLANGKTAEQTFSHTLDELAQKTDELTEDLASQDADAFLSHSRFLNAKFGKNNALEDPARRSVSAR
jgi:hypothetical protein